MGFFGRPVKEVDAAAWELQRVERNLIEAEARYLEVLRREVANLIVASDPDLMMRTYERALTYERDVARDSARFQADEASLTAKLRSFDDFDVLGTRHFVTYSEARSTLSDEDLVERYHELSRMLMVVNGRLNGEASKPVFDADEREVLRTTVRKRRDQDLRGRIDAAMDRYYAHRAGFERSGQSSFGADLDYADAKASVSYLRSAMTPDVTYGIHFPSTGEYALYSFFVHDDGRMTHMYDRADGAFQSTGSLAW